MDEVTMGELNRRLTRIENKLDEKMFVRQDVFDLWTQEVKEIRDSMKWVARSIAVVSLGLLGNVVFFIITTG